MTSAADNKDIFSVFTNYPSCSVVQTLEYKDRCQYVRTTPECQRQMKYISYLEILYCILQPHSDIMQTLCVILLMSICLLMFVILGCTADKVFCPALKVVSNVLGLNEHLAGVTLLAFGNGSPDLISTFSGVDEPGRILLSDLFGAAFYVITLIGGLLFVVYPFKLQANNVLRDTCFFMLACILVDYAMVSDNYVTIVEASLIMSVYLTYLVVIFLDQFFLKLSLRTLQRRMRLRKYNTALNISKLEQLRSEAVIEIFDHTSRVSIDVDLTRKMSYNVIAAENEGLFKQVLYTINPIVAKEWKESGSVVRLYIVVKAPVVFLLSLFIPIVDYELERHGWSKLLNCIQISLFPSVLLSIMFDNRYYFGVPLWAYSLIITVPISIYVLFTTRTDIPPAYHPSLAVYGMAGSIMLIYICAGETVRILYVLGIVTYSSNSFLGCTLQAWGNSIGDMVSTMALARHGYPRMGLAACFGGPFFNSIVSIGGTFLYNTIRSPEGIERVTQGPLCENCVIFLMLSLISVLVLLISTNFVARRSIGVFNFILYSLFFLFAILGESEVIETFAPESASMDMEALKMMEDN